MPNANGGVLSVWVYLEHVRAGGIQELQRGRLRECVKSGGLAGLRSFLDGLQNGSGLLQIGLPDKDLDTAWSPGSKSTGQRPGGPSLQASGFKGCHDHLSLGLCWDRRQLNHLIGIISHALFLSITILPCYHRCGYSFDAGGRFLPTRPNPVHEFSNANLAANS